MYWTGDGGVLLAFDAAATRCGLLFTHCHCLLSLSLDFVAFIESGPESAAHLAANDRSSPMPSITTDNASVAAPTEMSRTRRFGLRALGEGMDRKNPGPMRIEAAGTPIRTNHSSHAGSIAASARIWQINARRRITAAWAWPARKKFWRNGLSI